MSLEGLTDTAKIIKVQGILFFLVTEDEKCHSCILSIFLNLSLPLVVCTAEKAILANEHDAK